MSGPTPESGVHRPVEGDGLARGLWGLAALLALLHAGVFLALASQRLVYPFELEWMEGGSLEHLQRVLRGQPLYVEPGVEFVPFPYPPFYYYAAALLSPLLGTDLSALRMLSLLACLGSALLVGAFVRRETGRTLLAALCAGLFLATWRASGLYFDVARIDSLFVFLTLLSLWLLRRARGSAGLAAAGVVAALALMTKQTGGAVIAACGVWCLWLDWREHGARPLAWRRAWAYGAVAVGLCGLGTLLLDGVVDRHFLRHVVGAQPAHGIVPWKIAWFVGSDLGFWLPVALASALAAGLLYARNATPAGGFYLAAALGIGLACLVPRIKVSGAMNNLIPAHAWLVVLMGVSLPAVARRVAASGALSAAALERGIALAFALQLAWLLRWPGDWLPRESDRRAGERVEAVVARIEGEVWLPAAGYLAARAGKPVYAHQMPVSDYAKSGLPDAGRLEAEVAEALRSQRFAAILDSNTAFLRDWPPGVLERHYRPAGPVLTEPHRFRPVSGAPIRPGILWLPRERPADDGPPRAGSR